MGSQTGDFPPDETEFQHGQRRRQLTCERWFRKGIGMARELLREEIERWPWGYTVHRTVFTPESDIYWGAMVNAIQANIFFTLDRDLQRRTKENKDIHRILRDGYRTLVFQDKTSFDRA